MASMRGEFDKKNLPRFICTMSHFFSSLLLLTFNLLLSFSLPFVLICSYLLLWLLGVISFFKLSSSPLFSSSFLNSFIVIFSSWLFLPLLSSFCQIFFLPLLGLFLCSHLLHLIVLSYHLYFIFSCLIYFPLFLTASFHFSSPLSCCLIHHCKRAHFLKILNTKH